ncbi:MAG: sulfotransferase family protein [Longimicrobiales bacterium]
MTLPNFLIIGAGRSGTTSLYHYLRQHPEVFMSEVKEPSFFAYMDTDLPSGIPGADWLRQTAVTTRREYESLFSGATGARAIGEASPAYLANSAAPARIQALIPDARLVAILRHPADRAHASYLGLRRDGVDPAPTFEEALRDEERREREGWVYAANLVHTGFYYKWLSQYYARFPREQLHVYLFEDLVTNASALMQDLFAFLGVDSRFVPDVTHRYGGTGDVRNPIVRSLWTWSAVPRRLVRPFLPVRWRDGVFDWVTRDGVKTLMAPATRAQLVDVFRADIVALQDLIDRDLSAWLQ